MDAPCARKTSRECGRMRPWTCEGRRKNAQRSREIEANALQRAQFENLVRELESQKLAGEFNEAAFAEKVSEADARYRVRRLESAMSGRTATEERVVALKRAIKTFLRSQGGNSERALIRAFKAADVDNSGELDYDEFCDAVRNFGLKHLSVGALRTLFDAFDADVPAR